jgi:malate dehydrogenase (oxaloacetate-decarboxylating)(NADP+)
VAAGNILMCDTKGVIHRGREAGMNQWKSAYAVDTDRRTLEEALDGADMVLGLSVKGALTQAMIERMADRPIVFALANPDPEIAPDEVKAVRPEAIVATGRSDYPNQVNNVLGFPYIFRGALDVRARTINDAMKVAAARALAALAREDVPDEVDAAYSGRRLRFGPDYIIPVPFDPRLIVAIPPAVADAATATGVARRPIGSGDDYRQRLRSRLDPTAHAMQGIVDQVRERPQRVVFAEGERERMIRAAVAFANAGYGRPVLLGDDREIARSAEAAGLGAALEGVEIVNARLTPKREAYTDFLYERMQRRGVMRRDCERMINQNRNVFASVMLDQGDGDAMVTGLNRSFSVCYEDIRRVVDVRDGTVPFGLSILVGRAGTLFLADTTVNPRPDGAMLAEIAVQAAARARAFGHEPRVAFLSYSNFGQPMHEQTEAPREAVAALDRVPVDFEYDGEMSAEVALDPVLMRASYPFCRLTGPANVLVMPGLHAANIGAKLLQRAAGVRIIGPLLLGLTRSAQVVQMGATVNDLVTAAILAAHDALQRRL